MILHVYVDVYVLCVCIVGHGYSYTTVCVSIRWANFYFRVFIEYHYGCDGFSRETVGQKYLLHLSSVYRVKCLGEVYKW